MMCNCKVMEIVIGLVVLIFAFWQVAYSQWIIAIAAVVLIIHGFICPTMTNCMPGKMPMQKSSMPVKKKAARKKSRKKKK